MGKAPTQELGEAIFTNRPGVQGVVTLSARLPYHKVLVVFPKRLVKGRDTLRYAYTDSNGSSRTVAVP